MPYAFCSSKDCDYGQEFGARLNAFDEVVEYVSAKPFCGKCGASMLTACQNCKGEREQMSHNCCPDCGKPYK